MIDFSDVVTTATLAHAESLLSQWLPAGKRQGHEWGRWRPGAWTDDDGGIRDAMRLAGNNAAAAANAVNPVRSPYPMPTKKTPFPDRTCLAWTSVHLVAILPRSRFFSTNHPAGNAKARFSSRRRIASIVNWSER